MSFKVHVFRSTLLVACRPRAPEPRNLGLLAGRKGGGGGQRGGRTGGQAARLRARLSAGLGGGAGEEGLGFSFYALGKVGGDEFAGVIDTELIGIAKVLEGGDLKAGDGLGKTVLGIDEGVFGINVIAVVDFAVLKLDVGEFFTSLSKVDIFLLESDQVDLLTHAADGRAYLDGHGIGALFHGTFGAFDVDERDAIAVFLGNAVEGPIEDDAGGVVEVAGIGGKGFGRGIGVDGGGGREVEIGQEVIAGDLVGAAGVIDAVARGLQVETKARGNGDGLDIGNAGGGDFEVLSFHVQGLFGVHADEDLEGIDGEFVLLDGIGEVISGLKFGLFGAGDIELGDTGAAGIKKGFSAGADEDERADGLKTVDDLGALVDEVVVSRGDLDEKGATVAFEIADFVDEVAFGLDEILLGDFSGTTEKRDIGGEYEIGGGARGDGIVELLDRPRDAGGDDFAAVGKFLADADGLGGGESGGVVGGFAVAGDGGLRGGEETRFELMVLQGDIEGGDVEVFFAGAVIAGVGQGEIEGVIKVEEEAGFTLGDGTGEIRELRHLVEVGEIGANGFEDLIERIADGLGGRGEGLSGGVAGLRGRVVGN